VKGYVLAILKRARAERLISSDIIVDIECLADALKPNPPASRRPALTTLPELLAFQKAVDRSSADLLTKLASRLMALTLVRVSTLRLATWEEFDGIDWSDPESPAQKPIWRIPAGHMKLEQVDKGELGFGHDIPLCSQAVEVLRAIRQLTGRFDYAFPKATSWREPMTDSTLSGLYKRLEDGRYKG
jgi:integrase